MANYNYHCFDCEKKAFKKHADKLTKGNDGELSLPNELYEELILFETSHVMRPTKKELHEATECPRCSGHNCEKTFHGCSVHGYTKGYGWLDRAGAKRDLNRATLSENDPYAQYRVTGEVEHIDAQLKKEGQHQPKRKVSVPRMEMEKAVSKAISTPKPKDASE